MSKRVCWNCGGKGWINELGRSILSFTLFHIPRRATRDCDVCYGTGYINDNKKESEVDND